MRGTTNDPAPEFLEAGEEKAGIAGFLKIGFVPPTAEIGDPGKTQPLSGQPIDLVKRPSS